MVANAKRQLILSLHPSDYTSSLAIVAIFSRLWVERKRLVTQKKKIEKRRSGKLMLLACLYNKMGSLLKHYIF